MFDGADDISTNEALVASLKGRELLRTQAIVDAFLRVPRAMFVPEEFAAGAYIDRPFKGVCLSCLSFSIDC
jgi:protein-L-isoaspartate O-methyltransferase